MGGLRRPVSERGSVPIELALGVLVLLAPAALLVLSFGPLLERRNLVRALASETARAVVLTGGEVDRALARLVADAEAAGVDASMVEVGVCGPPAPVADVVMGCGLARGSVVEVTVRLPVEAPIGPGSVSYVHREPVPALRSRP